MHRIAIFLLGLGLAAAALERSAYQVGHEYVYLYEGQAATGLPQSSRTYSALKIQAQLKIQVKEAEEFALQAEDVKVMFLNGELPTAELPVAQLPFELFTQLTGSANTVIEEWLKKPVFFKYANGIVSNIRVEGAPPFWAVNIFRGILGILQININGLNAIQQDIQEVTQAANAYAGATGEEPMFMANEECVFGKCRAVYQIRKLPSPLNPGVTKVLNISKVLNHRRCKGAPIYFNSIIKGARMPINIAEAEILKMGTVVNYNISGTREEFVIESAEVIGEQTFAPLAPERGSAATFINQRVILKEAKPVSAPIAVPTRPTAIPSLVMELRPEMLEVELPLDTIPFGPVAGSARNPTVIRGAKAMIAAIIGARGENAINTPHRIIKLIKILRGATVEDLEEVGGEYIPVKASTLNANKLIVRRILLDVVPAIGTKSAMTYIKTLLEAKKLAISDRVAQVFSTAALITKPDKEIVDIVKTICLMPAVHNEVQMKRSCWLAWSALVRQMTFMKKDDPAIDLKPFWEDAKMLWTNMRSEEDKYLGLKVLGNAGLKESIEVISEAIHKTSHSRMIRVQAVFALRHLAKKLPTKVRTILFPMFANPREKTELRVACCKLIIGTHPPQAILDLMAASLLRETNLHVASFIYSHMKAISGSTMPSLRMLARRAKFALRFAKPVADGIHLPKYVHLPIFSEFNQLGAAIDLAYVPTHKSVLPQSGLLKLKTTILGYDINVFEAGIYTEGLQTLVDKFIGPHGSLRTSKSVLDVLKARTPRSVGGAKAEMEDIRSKLKLKPRRLQEPKGSAYIKMFGTELRFFTLGEDILKTMRTEGRISIKNVEEELRRGMAMDIQKSMLIEDAVLKVPTMLGIPLTVNLTALAHVHIKGDINVEVVPKLFAEERNGAAPTKIVAGITAKPKMIANVFATMGLHTPVLRTRAMLKVQMITNNPINGKVILDVANKKYKIMMDPNEAAREIVRVATEPLCVAKALEGNVWKKLGKKAIITSATLPQVKGQVEIGKNVLGHEIIVDYEMPDYAARRPSFEATPLTVPGIRSVVVKALPGLKPVKKLKVILDYATVKQSAPAHGSRPSLLWSIFGEEPSDSGSQGAAAFIPVTTRFPVPNPIKRILTANIIGDGQPRFVKAQITYIASETEPIHAWDVQVIRSAIPGYAPEKFKACLNWAVRAPKLPEVFTAPLAANVAKMEMEGHLMAGAECAEAKTITISYKITKSPEQLLEEHGPMIKTWSENIKCREDLAMKLKFTPACFRLMERLSELMTYELEIKYKPEHVSLWVREYLQWYLTTVLKYDILVPRVVVAHHDLIPRTNNGTVKMNMTISMVRPFQPRPARLTPFNWKLHASRMYSLVNISLLTPTLGKELILQAPLPLSMSARSSWFYRMTRYLTDNTLPAVCMVNGEHVRTFDKVEYAMPKTNCETVVASDCSPLARFLATAKAIPNTQKKILKVLLEGHKILIEPVGAALTVKVNGAVKPVTPAAPIIVREKPGDASSPIVIKIVRESAHVKVVAPLTLVVIEFTGEEAVVRASPFYFARTCGLCGDFNGEQFREFKGPEDNVFENAHHFAASYLVPGPQCHAEAITSQSGSQQIPMPMGTSHGVCRAIYTNVYYTKYIHNVHNTCFTKEAILRCTSGCRHPVKMRIPGQVEFVCLPANSYRARQLKHMVLYNRARAVSTLMRMRANGRGTVPIIETCM